VFKNKTVCVSVINDLVSDQRVYKTCHLLHEMGLEVHLIGRVLPHSPDLPLWPWKSTRMRLFFEKGPAFYFWFQCRLFLKLLFHKKSVLYANDLDTLLPNFLVAKLKGVPLIFDSHELFCDVPELLHTPIKRSVWRFLERYLVPRVKHRITVNQSIADVFYSRYRVPFHVVRNISDKPENIVPVSKSDLGFSPQTPLLILQGAGINVGRGAEELVLAMHHLEAGLIIIGSGDVWQTIEKLVIHEHLQSKIRLIPRVSREKLFGYTQLASVGLSLDRPLALNYELSLPNKLFDYVQAGVPVLASNLKEVSTIVNTYGIGICIETITPDEIVRGVEWLLKAENQEKHRVACENAATQLNWKHEKQVLKDVILRALEAPAF